MGFFVPLAFFAGGELYQHSGLKEDAAECK
jgi:hypothetical protein